MTLVGVPMQQLQVLLAVKTIPSPVLVQANVLLLFGILLQLLPLIPPLLLPMTALKILSLIHMVLVPN